MRDSDISCAGGKEASTETYTQQMPAGVLFPDLRICPPPNFEVSVYKQCVSTRASQTLLCKPCDSVPTGTHAHLVHHRASTLEAWCWAVSIQSRHRAVLRCFEEGSSQKDLE